MAFKSCYVEPILFGYMFCLYLLMPIENQLIYHKVCDQTFNDTYCQMLYASKNKTLYKDNENLIQEKTAHWSMYLSIVRTLPALVSVLFYGAWSDKVGRKTIMILPIFGDTMLGIGYVLNSYFINAAIPYMFIGAFLSACFGNFAAVISSTYSYVADITDHSSRTKRIIILESMIFLGAVIGNISGGWLLQKSGFIAVFCMIIAVYVLLFVYWLFLKESYEGVQDRHSVDLKDFLLNKVALRETLNVIFKQRKERCRMTLWILLGCLFFLLFFFVAVNAIAILFVMHQPLNFPPSQIGYFLAEINGVKFAGASFINLVLVHKLRISDYSIIMIAVITFGGFLLSIANSLKDWHVYLSVLWCLGMGTGESTVRAALSKMVASDEQGKLFAATAFLSTITSLAASTAFIDIYKRTVWFMPSFSFYLLAGLTLIPFTLSLILLLKGQRVEYEQLEDE